MGQIYNVLTDDEIQSVHEASLKVLKTTGLHLDHPLALERLADVGAHVVRSRKRVLIPSVLVEKALEAVPKQFVCAGRTPEFDRVISSGSAAVPVVRAMAGAINHFDLRKNTSRPMTIQDCVELGTLADALKTIGIVSCPAPPTAPPRTYDLHTLKALLESGRKHIWALPKNAVNLRYQLEMMKAVAGGTSELRKRPLCSGIVCLIEPLYFPKDEIDRLLIYAEHNLPVKVPLAPMIGANAPYTLAGALAYTNAEALGALTLLQTLCPGIPTWYYTIPHLLEMKDGATYYLCPEVMLVNAGLAQLARHYNIPSSAIAYNSTGCQAHQIMFERGAALTMYALSGISEYGGAGALEGGLSMSLLALVIDDQLADYTFRLNEGFQINRETLAVDAINRVGHNGNFMTDMHTLEFLHREKRFKPDIFEWRPHEIWKSESRTILDRAHEKLTNILQTHEIPPLDETLQNELDHIILAAEKELTSV